MKRLWLTVAALALASVVSARGGQGRMERVVGRVLRDPVIAARAGIDEKDVNRLRQAYFTHRKEVARLWGQLRLAEIELQEAKSAAVPDLDDIDTRIEKVSSLRTALEKSRVRFELSVREIVGRETLSKLRHAAWRAPAGRTCHRQRGRARLRQGGGPLAEGMGNGPDQPVENPGDLIASPEL
ncbi:MAG TPA: periplasmic heavy metal sensor [Kiritimatiellae bacterium]|nr:periplasmic heavy metal sensor [Kiritimatiellia bacterium]